MGLVWVVKKGFLEEVTAKPNFKKCTRRGRIFQVWEALCADHRVVKNGIVCVRN